MKKFFNSLIAGLGYGKVLSTTNKRSLDAKAQAKLDAQCASKSQRTMNLQRGSRDKAHVGEHRIYRSLKRARKAIKRYSNNLNKPGSVGHNPRRHAILVKRQQKQIIA